MKTREVCIPIILLTISTLLVIYILAFQPLNPFLWIIAMVIGKYGRSGLNKYEKKIDKLLIMERRLQREKQEREEEIKQKILDKKAEIKMKEFEEKFANKER